LKELGDIIIKNFFLLVIGKLTLKPLMKLEVKSEESQAP
jgi:hypothetical protein